MNRGFLIIAVPAFVVSIFWLMLGWGWHTAVIGGCLEIALAVGVTIYITRRQGAPHNPGPGSPPSAN
ncbi:MAG: hypothetical protein WA192_13110 [Candidatus Acidiferrales bacterium]